jgi:hypothetical protein
VNEELRKALEKLHETVYAKGWRDRLPLPREAVDTFTTAGPDDDTLAAWVAVVAIFERERAVANQLAEALDESKQYFPCHGCYMNGHAPVECIAKRNCTLADDWQRIQGLIDTALAAYAALEGK